MGLQTIGINTATNSVYVVNKNDNTVSIIDPIANQAIGAKGLKINNQL